MITDNDNDNLTTLLYFHLGSGGDKDNTLCEGLPGLCMVSCFFYACQRIHVKQSSASFEKARTFKGQIKSQSYSLFSNCFALVAVRCKPSSDEL